MAHYTGAGMVFKLGGTMLPGIRELTTPEEHAAPDTTYAGLSHGGSIRGGITQRVGCQATFVDDSAHVAWAALAGGTTGLMQFYPLGSGAGMPALTGFVVVTNRARTTMYGDVAVFTVTFSLNGPLWAGSIYVGTLADGVYFTRDWVYPGVTPVWTPMNTGLTELALRWLMLESDRTLWAMSETSRLVFRWNGSTWVQKLSQADLRTEVSEATAILEHIAPGSSGRVWALGYLPNVAYSAYVYLGYSDDDGDSWTWTTIDVNTLVTFLSVRNAPILRTRGTALAFSTSNGANQYAVYSANNGGAWSISATLGGSLWNVWLQLAVNALYCAGNGTNGPDLVRVALLDMAQTVLQGTLDIGPGRPDSLWIDPTDEHVQRVLKSDVMRRTRDRWSSVVATSAALTPSVHSVFVPYVNRDVMLIGKASGIVSGTPHHIFTLNGESASLVGAAGADPENASTTVSIPYDAGGVCYDGIQVAEVYG